MQASRDENHVPVFLGASNADGVTPLAPIVDPVTHILMVDNGSGGSDLSDEPASRDENHVPVAMGVSSADGVTPVPVYVDSVTQKLLIDIS
jgi:hypothetical protein